MIELNKKVDDFTLLGIDEDGEEKNFSLSAFKGKTVIVYFYPKDNTPGCTTEACDFRDNMNRLTSKASVIGISPDNTKSHLIFKNKHGLNFPLLSDPDHKVMEYFGAWGEKNMYGKIIVGVKRSTFVIDKDGVLKKAWNNVRVKGHVDKVLEYLETM